MYKINIKPLSVNEAWQGRRFKTDKYKEYEKNLLFFLPNDLNINKDDYLKIYLEFGFSNFGSDWDNPIKPFVDVLQKKYNFNDSKILEANVIKKKVKKKEEYIKFNIIKI